jgi:hypothetical protein
MRIRQIALVAQELEPVVDQLCQVLGVEVCFRDPGVGTFGLHNALMPLSDALLEVVSPVKEGTSAGRYLDRRGGDGGYMLIVQTEDLDADRKRLAELGVRVVWETSFPDIATIHLHPADVGGAILSLDLADPPESWRWAGPGWETKIRDDVSGAIVAAELQSGDPAALAERWSAILDRKLEDAESGPVIRLDGSDIRFVAERDGRGPGIAGFDVVAVDPAELLERARSRDLVTGDGWLEICGTRIRPVSAG